MPNAKFTSIAIENFKSHAGKTSIDLRLLTVVIGRNNSGKSSIVQALLMLKQTLEFARLDVPLRLEGYVEALSIRELTHGWPDPSEERVVGPTFYLEWESTIDIRQALEELENPNLTILAANLPWISNNSTSQVAAKCSLQLEYVEERGKIVLARAELCSTPNVEKSTKTIVELERAPRKNLIATELQEESVVCHINGQRTKKIIVSFEHFLPYLTIDRRNAGPRHGERTLANSFHVLFSQSLDDLKRLIKGFSYLSSTRGVPPSIYRPSTEPLDDVGVSGENAAEMLQSHQSDCVHYLLPDFNNPFHLPALSQQSLKDAVNGVLTALGIETSVSIEEIQNVGFRLLFGKANLSHVGRGLTYLLPLIQVGLICDPLRFQLKKSLSIEDYKKTSYVMCAFEEPEAHLHPKIQSRLAQWFLFLAMAQRQVLVETHSDHFVRKLRLLIAQAPAGSEIENWLSSNVNIVSVKQDAGVSATTSSHLNKDGGLEIWPTDFMDEASTTEEDIYLSALKKSVSTESSSPTVEFQHHQKRYPDEGID